MTDHSVDLSAALDSFDKVEANIVKLEAVWQQLRSLIGDGVSFGNDDAEVDALLDAFRAIAEQLPAVDGYRLEASPMSPDEAAQARFDALELGELDVHTRLEDAIRQPGRDIADYRRRVEGARRSLVRERVVVVVASIEALLRDANLEGRGVIWRGADRWLELGQLVSELDRLVAGLELGHARWSELHRHLHFGQAGDLADIVTMDWPSVKEAIERSLYDDHEPIPVSVDDLGALVRARPTGPVSSRVDWTRIDDEGFEGLVFELVRNSDGYENANWLMRTNASDRGRDIEVYRVINDPLGDTRRYRVIIQCKHWQTKSVGRMDIIACVESVKLGEPPKVDTLIVATSGRFAQDAVALKEKYDHERNVPSLELWPDNHLERIISRRPHIAASFGLR